MKQDDLQLSADLSIFNSYFSIRYLDAATGKVIGLSGDADFAVDLSCSTSNLIVNTDGEYTKSMALRLIFGIINPSFHDAPKVAPVWSSLTKHQIEHVLPQTLTPEWESNLGSWGESNIQSIHAESCHTLGNLTLTKQNQDLAQLPFREKQPKLLDESLGINRFFSNLDRWTKQLIHQRSELLTKHLIPLLPAPLSVEQYKSLESQFGNHQQFEPDGDSSDLALFVSLD